ncbi:MAG: tetratricopeptide repeat protein [Bacteroidia bacterium]
MLKLSSIIFLLFSGLFLQAYVPPQDSLLTAIKAAKEDTHKINLLIDLHNYYISGDQKKARENLDQILLLSRKLNFPKGIFKGEIYMALNLLYKPDYPSADSAINIAIAFAQKNDNLLWEAEGWKAKASIYGSGWGKTDSAYILNQKSAEMYHQLGLRQDEAFVWAKMGMMQQVLGNYDEALTLFQDAIEVFQEKGEAASARMAMVAISMGNVYSTLKNHELAKKYYEDALEYDKGKMPSTRAVVLYNLGITVSNIEAPESAFPYYREAYLIFDTLGQNGNAAATLNMIGYIFNEMKDFDSAAYYYRKAATIQEETHAYESLAVTNLNIGNSLMNSGRLEEAEKYLLGVLNMKEVQLDNQTELLAYQNLGDVYIRMGKYKEASEYLGKAITLKDSTMHELKAQIAQKEVDFQTQLKDAEIERQQLVIKEQETRETFQVLIFGLIVILWLADIVFYRFRQNKIKREAELTAQVKEAEAESLREIDRVKSRFFANISHEFRTPLTLILGPIKQLFKKSNSPEDKKSLTLVQRNAERLLDLVNQLLDLSKLESGKMDLQLSRGDIITFIKGIVFSFESLADIKQIRYHTYFPNRAIETSFDKDKLEKVLTNLLSNAFKFTPEEGDIRVETTISSEPSGKNFLEITIQDNGMGIPEDQLEHIFDRFYQIEGNEIQGTGIGLALTKELIELQQGNISVSSVVGQGSLFTISLPLDEIKTIESAQDISSIIVNESIAEQIAGELPRLLLVEDNEDVRLFIADQLRESHQLMEAPNGAIGFEMAVNEIPDLIITDVMMPVMDGNALTKKLKTDARTSHIPVIMLTAKSGKENKIEGLETGADDYLTKPFDGDELTVRIRNLIQQRKLLRERFRKDITLKPKDIAITSADEQFLQKIIDLIEKRMDDEMLSVEEVASEVALSRSQLHRKLKALTDHSPSTFIRSIRLKRAKDLLEQQAAGVAEVAYQVGFSSPTYFSKCFKDEFGVSPVELRNG